MTYSSSQLHYPEVVTLNECDKEPIHIIGKIQSHGYLIAFDMKSSSITRCSSNSSLLFKKEITEILDKKISDFFDVKLIKDCAYHLIANNNFHQELSIHHETYSLIGHQSGGEYIFELEKNNSAFSPLEYIHRLTDIVSEVSAISNIEDDDTVNRAAKLVKDYLNYNRVVIYKFDQEWNGQVIAEEKEDHLKPWLGLHYPASDIPKQARAIFLKQNIRMICDIDAENIPILTSSKFTENQNLDLTNSELRTSSPIHLEYLQNIGSKATLTIAIIHDNKLWGLISCHHQSPKYVSYSQRLSCTFLSQVFSTQIQSKYSKTSLNVILKNEKTLTTLTNQITKHSILGGLAKQATTILDLNTSTGAAICIDNNITTLGDCPKKEVITALVKDINQITKDYFYYTNQYGRDTTNTRLQSKDISGVLCVFISNLRENAILWFKPEKRTTVNWAGKPEKIVSKDNTVRLSPRKSFEKWSEEQNGKAIPWEEHEINSARRLKKTVLDEFFKNYAQEVLTLNEQLSAANKDLESFSYSVSHDLRAPLRGVDGFSRILKEEYYDQLDEFGKTTLENIINSADKMNRLIDDILMYAGLGAKPIRQHYFDIEKSIYQTLTNFKDQYPNTHIAIEPNLPNVYGDPSLIEIVLKNLIENALKYSSKTKNPQVHIGFKNKTTFYVKDNGIGFDPKHKDKIYNVFVRLVNTEFKGTGIGLSIVKRIIEKHHGKIWFETEQGKGTTFYVQLNDEH